MKNKKFSYTVKRLKQQLITLLTKPLTCFHLKQAAKALQNPLKKLPLVSLQNLK